MEEKTINKIIEVAYGGGSLFDKMKIRKLISENSEAKAIYDEYSSTASDVHKLTLEDCPDEIISNSISNLEIKVKNRFFLDLYELLFTKPAYTAAIMAVTSIVIISTIFIDRPQPESLFTPQEVEVADKQVKEALLIVSHLFVKSKDTIKEDVLTNKVSKPLNKGINIVNNLLEEGGEK
ncbi:MAG: hypothetical protein K9J12_04345 [Melioribacteraceae bacterium]|nr:hypothetical protein [Melioribacteraceae bacterium]MCF8265102.1 hypothetical protein [Melioribacteraceae bacterium]MCF8413221.1 hypothetical protein [Melioribacteraceae bacterium]MCF8431188.1 hypothetical protein [Melioribacteraceae bacterium]